ncbi:unnamed protein product [Linum trigynum]|uniref:Uncharacterized protein n=1 Tax=Linum trigynum TaxID=586398 RepID=A0AAV2CEL4_9ROSI
MAITILTNRMGIERAGKRNDFLLVTKERWSHDKRVIREEAHDVFASSQETRSEGGVVMIFVVSSGMEEEAVYIYAETPTFSPRELEKIIIDDLKSKAERGRMRLGIDD